MKYFCEECNRETIHNEISAERFDKITGEPEGEKQSTKEKLFFKFLRFSQIEEYTKYFSGVRFYECECCGSGVIICRDGSSYAFPISDLKQFNIALYDLPLVSDKFSLDEECYEKNIEIIKLFYFRVNLRSFDEIIINAGRCYNDIFQYNIRMGKWFDKNKFDHELIFYIAGWILQNRNYQYIRGYNQYGLSRAITDNILSFLEYKALL